MKYISFLSVIMIPSLLNAHPGHGSGHGFELIHFLSSPAHIIIVVAFSALAVGIWKYYKKGVNLQ